MLAPRAWYKTWECGQQDWNTAGYSDAMKGEACDASVPEVVRLVKEPNIIAALRGPKGDIGVVSTDWKVGYAPSADAGITWLWRMTECTYLEESRGLRCFEELR